MMIFFLNSKKCLTLKHAALALSFLIVTPTWADAATPKISQLRKDIQKSSGTKFEPLLESWKLRYGSTAAMPLLKIASDKSVPDTQRYIALMGATRLGGKHLAHELTGYLKDKAWMVRMAALRALRALNASEHGALILPLLKDKALVVRAEAVSAIEILNPPGAIAALKEAVKDPSNYHRGKPLWIPELAKAAVEKLTPRP